LKVLIALMMTVSVFAQTPRRYKPTGAPIGPHAMTAEMAIKQAMEGFGDRKKALDRDLEVLTHLRIADDALTDPMQPFNAIQKAYEEVDAAKSLTADFNVKQGTIKMERELESARLSPASADFGRLRAMLSKEALGPSVGVATRNALRLQEETLAWLRVQELISAHVRALSEITGDSLRAVEGK
jgi:hypothetical protein